MASFIIQCNHNPTSYRNKIRWNHILCFQPVNYKLTEKVWKSFLQQHQKKINELHFEILWKTEKTSKKLIFWILNISHNICLQQKVATSETFPETLNREIRVKDVKCRCSFHFVRVCAAPLWVSALTVRTVGQTRPEWRLELESNWMWRHVSPIQLNFMQTEEPIKWLSLKNC